jgi:hypothetical protein
MARIAIESQAAPAAPGPIENRVQELAAMLMVALGCVALLDPGVLLGATVAGSSARCCSWSRCYPYTPSL